MNLAFIRTAFLVENVVSTVAILRSHVLRSAYRGKTIRSTPLLNHSNVWDRLSCAVICMNAMDCFTFNYSPNQKKCWVYSRNLAQYRDKLVDDEDKESIVITIPQVKTFIKSEAEVGKRCNRSYECNFQDGVCYDGVCLCRLGLHFSTTLGSCLKDCDEYSEEIDFYNGAAIKQHNDKALYKRTLAECCRFCVADRNDLKYKTLEWHGDYRKAGNETASCHLSRSSYLDVDQRFRIVNERGWVLGQRRCK